MDKYKEMLERPNKKYKYSELELGKIISLLDYCHAVDVRMTHRRMYEVFFKCDALPGMELTIDSCSDQCAKYGCSNCTAAEDAECIINQEKSVLDLEPSDEFYFKDEVKSIIKRYHGDKSDKMTDSELEMIVAEIKKELKCFNCCIGEYKTIKYLFDSYEIELSEKLAQDIRNNKVSDEDFDYICKELEITPDERTLQSIVIHALNPVLLHDIVVDDSEETHFQNDSVYASYHTDIVGEFLFDDEDKPHKDIEDECLMVCFYVPCVWDMKDADIPADKYMASLRIKEAVKAFLKDDINWEERLGELYASGYNT